MFISSLRTPTANISTPAVVRSRSASGRLQLSRGQEGRLPGRRRTFTANTSYQGAARKVERRIKLSHSLGITAALCSATYLVGLFAPPAIVQIMSPRPAPPPPTADSEEGLRITEQIEMELNNLELLRKCREAPDANDWYEVRPYASFPEERRVNSLTAGALRGPGKITVPPIVRSKKDESEAWIFIHLGRGVCGHDGIVHGGLLATLLDEGLARVAVLNLPSRLGVTANLSIDFRAPTKANQFIVLKTKLVEQNGRKSSVQGRIEDLDGTLLAEAKALFIEPKVISKLDSIGLRAIFPSWEKKVAQMAGAPAAKHTPGGAHVIDVDVDEAERESSKSASKKS